MQWNYVFLLFILGLVVSIIIKFLVSNNMCQMVHTIEFIAALLAIVFCLRNIYPYFVLAVLIFFMYRTMIRIVGDCVTAFKENKEGKNR